MRGGGIFCRRLLIRCPLFSHLRENNIPGMIYLSTTNTTISLFYYINNTTILSIVYLLLLLAAAVPPVVPSNQPIKTPTARLSALPHQIILLCSMRCLLRGPILAVEGHNIYIHIVQVFNREETANPSVSQYD